MGRVKLEVAKEKLISVITEIEANGSFINRSALADAIANTEWAKNYNPRPITTSVILSRIDEYNIELKTPKGKRGRQSGVSLTDDQKKKMMEGRNQKNKMSLNELRKATPEKRKGLVNKIENGSRSAAMKLMCLFCTDHNTQEIKHCTISKCPLFSFRPYQ